jgi:hypothetical protein
MEDHDGAGWPEHADDLFADPVPDHGEEEKSQGATDWADTDWASASWAGAGESGAGESGADRQDAGEVESGEVGTGEGETVAPVAVTLTVPRPETGEARVDDALSLLDDLPELPVAEHPDVFARVHARLGEVLGELASGPLAGAAGRDGS